VRKLPPGPTDTPSSRVDVWSSTSVFLKLTDPFKETGEIEAARAAAPRAA